MNWGYTQNAKQRHTTVLSKSWLSPEAQHALAQQKAAAKLLRAVSLGRLARRRVTLAQTLTHQVPNPNPMGSIACVWGPGP